MDQKCPISSSSSGNVNTSEQFDLNETQGILPQTYRIGTGPKGRGLFAIQDMAPKALVHVAPCIRISKEEYQQHARHTVLEHYLFNDRSDGSKLLALGYGSLFNHAKHPNIDYRVNSTGLCIRYLVGHKAIRKGEELCISYGANLWFDDADGDDSESISSDDTEDLGVATFLTRMKL